MRLAVHSQNSARTQYLSKLSFASKGGGRTPKRLSKFHEISSKSVIFWHSNIMRRQKMSEDMDEQEPKTRSSVAPDTARGKKAHEVRVNGNRVKLYLEEQFWDALEEVARGLGLTRPMLVREIYKDSSTVNMTAKVRIFILEYYTRKIGPSVNAN
jgi:predicted DNA-binding ribbon-helix-helix protein